MNDFLRITPRQEDISGQPILRPLPSAKCRSVGPFVFFDHILENTYPAGSGMNINQHPHIALSTLPYLFEPGFGSSGQPRRSQLDDRRQSRGARRAHPT